MILALLPPVMIVGILANGLRLRARATVLPVVRQGEYRSSGEGTAWLVASGVQVDDALRSSLEGYRAAQGLEVLDVIPADLPADAALTFLRTAEPATYRADRITPGRGAGQALVATQEVLRRAEVKATEAMDPAAVLTDTVEVKKYVPTTMGFAVAPGLAAGNPGGRRGRLLALGIPVPLSLMGPLLGYAALAAGCAANPLWGIGALVAFSAQPYLVFAGTPLRPRDLHRAALGRVVWDPLQWVRAASGPRGAVADEERARHAAAVEEARPAYAADLAAGVDRFFEPARTDCPWCGGTDLAAQVRTPDLHQGKPGRFRLDRCRSCGHVFQNPRLTIPGLEFYYRDFYDGAGEAQLESAFGAQSKAYRSRAEMLRAYTTDPGSWLDVGTGHGHFCTVARDVWPATRFDGLEMTDGIEYATRRGWVDRGYRGMFPEVAPELAGSYDVVSMSHYLEHTREPMEELDAAAIALKHGGHLLIEVPDPEWPMGRLLRRFWLPWLQPQHQHLIPIANLKAALAKRGLEPVGERRDINPIPFDLCMGVYLLAHRLTRDPNVAWAAHRPGAARQVLRYGVLILEMPVLVFAGIGDLLLSLPLRLTGKGTAYRVVARKVIP